MQKDVDSFGIWPSIQKLNANNDDIHIQNGKLDKYFLGCRTDTRESLIFQPSPTSDLNFNDFFLFDSHLIYFVNNLNGVQQQNVEENEVNI